MNERGPEEKTLWPCSFFYLLFVVAHSLRRQRETWALPGRVPGEPGDEAC